MAEGKAIFLASEDATNKGVILPIVAQLGWDRENVREVVPENRVGSRRVEYCLRIGHKIRVFIEAERTDQTLEKHQEQRLDYAFREDIKLAALTNGDLWWFMKDEGKV